MRWQRSLIASVAEWPRSSTAGFRGFRGDESLGGFMAVFDRSRDDEFLGGFMAGFGDD
jgi:hypothetical protein